MKLYTTQEIEQMTDEEFTQFELETQTLEGTPINMYSNVELVESVKLLNTLPNTKLVTSAGIAEYFEVSENTINKITERNAHKLQEDGFCTYRKDEIITLINKYIVEVESKQEKFILTLKDGDALEVPNRGLRIYTYEAILRIAMYLQESEVANTVQDLLIHRNRI